MRKHARLPIAIGICIAAILFVPGAGIAQSGSSGPASGTQSEFPQYMPNVVPPSPDAWSFTRYGNLPIGLNTGTAQYTLPVYTVQSGSLSHAISIGYSSNGVKVDEMATRVGINWNLRAGGMITRNIMDLPDEGTAAGRAFFHGYAAGGEDSWTFYNYVKQASFGVRPDYQPDEYSFNVDGYSGKFLKREDGGFMQFTSSAVKIEQNSSGFILTAPTGVKYYFYLSETAKSYSYPEVTGFEWLPGSVPTGWYLTKIISPARDSIVFNYAWLTGHADSVMRYKNGISQNYSTGTLNQFYVNTSDYNLGSRGLYAPDMPYIDASLLAPPGLVNMVQVTDNHPAILTSVDFAGGQVNFVYSGRDDVPGEKKLDSVKVVRQEDGRLIKCMALGYAYSQAAPGSFDTYIFPSVNYTNGDSSLRKRLFLSSFDEVASDLAAAQRQSFEYEDINGLPPRLSFSQDRYGSFNGKVNTTYFFPNDTWFDKHIGNNQFGGDRSYSFVNARKGMLKKIIYPTGGYTGFNYEPNKTETDYAYLYQRDSVYTSFDTSTYVGQQLLSGTFEHDGQHEISLKGFCEWASFPVNTHHNGVDTAIEGVYHIYFDIIDISTNTCVNICSNVMEPGVVFANGNFGLTLPQGTYRIRATANRPRLRAKIVVTRLKRTADRSDSSGVAGVRVQSISDFATTGQETNRREFIYGSWDDSTSSSGTGLNLTVNNGNEVSMTRAVGPTYMNQNDVGNCGYNTLHSNSVLTSFLSENNTVLYKKVIELNAAANGRNNGGTEYEFYYDQKKYPIPVTFTWGADVWDPAPVVPNGASYMNNDYRTGLLKGSKAFTYAQKHGTRSILQETNNYYSLDTANLLIDTFTVSREVIKRTGRVPTWTYFWDFDIYRYWRYYGFLKQDSLVQKEYNTAGQVTNKVVFSSYNLTNYKADTIEYSSSAGDAKKIGRKYVSAGQEPGMYYANMVDALVEEKTYTAGREMTKKMMDYGSFNGIYLPAFVYSSRKNLSEYVEVAYEKYDSSGNLLQYIGRDSVPVSVIWGYDARYPVAKIAGKGYDAALSESGIDMAVVKNPASDAALQAELDKLLTLDSSLVTTYIYDPLIGVKRQTDPNGKRVYYEYDRFNRLSLVRDQDSNIVKKVCYNYAGQPVDCGYGTAAAWQAVSSTCETNSEGNTGTMIVTEKDMNPSSATYNQTRTVTLPSAGTCPLCVEICIGNDKKCMSGVCVTGVKIQTSAIYESGHWNVTYHYLWPDCSVSADYLEVLDHEPLLLEEECE